MRDNTSFTVAASRTLFEIKSWLPEHVGGRGRLNIVDSDLPNEVGATLAGPIHALCLGPAEWLLASDNTWATSFRRHALPELSARGLTAVDVSAGVVVLNISGSAARDLLSKGCGLDLHQQAFPKGRCARTRFAQIPLIIDCLDDSGTFDLYVGRSYLRYLSDWLEDAAVEFTA